MSTLVGFMWSIIMLPYAFMHVYIVFLIWDRFCLVFYIYIYFFFNLVLKRQIETETNFRIMFICSTFNVHVLYILYSPCVRFEFVKSPEVNLSGWWGYKPSININNKNNNNNNNNHHHHHHNNSFKMYEFVLVI